MNTFFDILNIACNQATIHISCLDEDQLLEVKGDMLSAFRDCKGDAKSKAKASMDAAREYLDNNF